MITGEGKVNLLNTREPVVHIMLLHKNYQIRKLLKIKFSLGFFLNIKLKTDN